MPDCLPKMRKIKRKRAHGFRALSNKKHPSILRNKRIKGRHRLGK